MFCHIISIKHTKKYKVANKKFTCADRYQYDRSLDNI